MEKQMPIDKEAYREYLTKHCPAELPCLDMVEKFHHMFNDDAYRGNTSAGKGWVPLITKALEQLDALHIPDFKIVQIKEKFGGLRLYVDRVSEDVYDEVHKIIGEAEEEAWKTCEFCGTKDDVEIRNGGWIKTLCGKCEAERQAERQAERKKRN